MVLHLSAKVSDVSGNQSDYALQCIVLSKSFLRFDYSVYMRTRIKVCSRKSHHFGLRPKCRDLLRKKFLNFSFCLKVTTQEQTTDCTDSSPVPKLAENFDQNFWHDSDGSWWGNVFHILVYLHGVPVSCWAKKNLMSYVYVLCLMSYVLCLSDFLHQVSL